VFNLQGSEIIFILLIALVVLGPEKLPSAIKRVMSLYHELRKLSSGFQDEFKSVLDEPLREMKSTADLMKNAADPKRFAEEMERDAERDAAAERKAKQARTAAEGMEVAGAAHLAASRAERIADIDPEIDAFADPVDGDEDDGDDDVGGGVDEDDGDDDVGGGVDDEGIKAVDVNPSVHRLSSVDLEEEDEVEPDLHSGDELEDKPEEKSA
jgi:sec-independent protein translocase protein TatB